MDSIIAKQALLLKTIAMNHGENSDPVSMQGRWSKGELVEYIKDHQFFLNQEIVELIEAIGGKDIVKPWKVNHKAVVAEKAEITAEMRSEAIDMLCFCLDICLAVGINSSNIAQEFNKVFDKNMSRQNNGY